MTTDNLDLRLVTREQRRALRDARRLLKALRDRLKGYEARSQPQYAQLLQQPAKEVAE